MALVPVVTLEPTADQVTLSDVTGNYNVTTNPTGYETPNAAFTDFARYVQITKKNVNDVDDVVLTLDSYNVLTATSFTADRDVDGWYEGKHVLITKWTAGTYAENVVRYYSGSVYVVAVASTSSVPGADANWQLIADVFASAAIVAPYVIITTINRDFSFDASLYWSQQIAELTQQGNLAIPIDDRSKERLDTIQRTITQVEVADDLGNNTAGEWCVLRLQRLGAKK